MNYDAQEAALGLLSLSPSTTFIQPVPLVTSNPLKRKQHPQTNHQPPQRPNPSKGRSKQSIVAEREKQKQKSKDDVEGEVGDVSSESIRCICGSTFDDGFSIACDDCSRWCHAACFDIAEGSVPEQWSCWVCVPRPVDRDRAAKLQRSRQRAMEDAERERLALLSQPQQQRRTSPGVERKHRRVSAPAIEGSKKRRRMSTVSTQPPNITTQPPNFHPSTGEDTPVDVCTDADEPKSHYVHITEDIVVSSSTTAKLRQQAQNWRGITALTPYPPPASSTPTTLQPLPTEPTSVRPPSYALHTTSPVPSNSLLAPFPSTITPSAAYLSDPLNGYAHLGMPKPHVHLMGPPLDLALDARITGNETRFVRSGCWPNAVLRPVLCKKSREDERMKEKAWRDARQKSDGAGNKEPQGKAERKEGDEQTTLAFAVFALRDLKANEEVVLGWEWDDGNAVHALPALLQTPHMFPPAHVQHLRSQLSNILHALGSTFTTCACGERAKGCAIREMEAFVEGGSPLSGEATKHGRIPVGAEAVRGERVWVNGDGMEWEQGGQKQIHSGSLHPHQQHRREHEQQQRQRYHHRHATLHDTSVNVAGPSTLRPPSPPPQPVDLGPLLGAERGFRTREKVAWAGGMGGVEMVGGFKKDSVQPRRRPIQTRGSRAESRMGENGNWMALDDEVTETWDEEGDVDVEGEEERGIGRGPGVEDDVDIEEDVDVEMDGYDDFSSNRGTCLSFCE
ncbi:hypothetical protein BDZ94DRAFT_538912 [Collybia nuda]|uniref:PHD-type domain-containing protein n=1 Tax=Collybia nuda TaxID=64659 RepID=A0A9P5XQM8_9AGAR|nr:hypothetical protein BDZ94DRAFT_538912 [Collybia nuda]